MDLVRDLDAVIALLSEHRVDHWTRLLTWRRDAVVNGEPSAITDLAAALDGGGAGSWLDLVIHPMNGHDIAIGAVEAANQRLRALQHAIYLDVVALTQ